jgi:hypothetical protein
MAGGGALVNPADVGSADAAVAASPPLVAARVPGFRAVPQRGQNAKSTSHGIPHARQAVGCRRPQRGQKTKSGESSELQPAQAINFCGQISCKQS